MQKRIFHREDYEVAVQNLCGALSFGCKRNPAKATQFADTIHGYVLQLEAEVAHAKEVLGDKWVNGVKRIVGLIK